ncbi:MAG: uroporphyrinogen decarboxylase [Spirochaetaceae bacterium]|nr:MAG: uroporphyrinogen decarboxylase [Spirochaetaceae bacterium]
MTRAERVRTALGHEPPDRCPWQIELTGDVAARLANGLGVDPRELDEWAGNHCAKLSLTGGEVSNDGTLFRDDWGVEWDRSGLDRDIGIIASRRIERASLAGFSPPRVDADQVRARLDAWFAKPRDRFVFAKIGTLLFERAWSLCGLEEFLMLMATEPDFVHELVEVISEYNERLVSIALDYPIDGFYFGDDFGQQSGMIMSPAMWHEYFEPPLRRLFAVAHGAPHAPGAAARAPVRVVALHSCGKIDAILDSLIGAGLDVYQTVQPEVYDLIELKNRYGDRLSFWGAISTQRDLPVMAADQVRELVRRTVETLGARGGYIAGPTHRVPADVPDDAIIAMVEALRGDA